MSVATIPLAPAADPAPDRTPLARAHLRLLPAPDTEPPPIAMDDTAFAVAPTPGGPGAGRHVQLSLVVGRPEPAVPPAAPRSARQDPRAFALGISQGIVDVLAGHRSPHQMMRWMRPDVFDWIRRRAAVTRTAGAGMHPVVRSVRVCQVNPDTVEASAVIVDGRRAKAMAFRLDGVGPRWRVTALVMG